MQGVVSGAVVRQGGVPHLGGQGQHLELGAVCSFTACARTEPCSAAVKAARVSTSLLPHGFHLPRPHAP